MTGWWRRFLVKGVFWRKCLRFGVHYAPPLIEPIAIATTSLLFLLFSPGRRGVMRNLSAIKPRSWTITNFFRAYRVFWNFAWTIADTGRFKEQRTIPDWEFVGLEHFEKMLNHDGGAIILTAHMGSYDLGARLFSESSDRRIVMVRAPEADPQTREFEEASLARASENLRIGFSNTSSDLALDLLHAVNSGELVAIQGDRVTPGIATYRTTMFGKDVEMPAGPFALAMAARVPIFPMFIVRLGRRRYRLMTCPPISVERVTRKRDEALQGAIDSWAAQLEGVIGQSWYQWFAFEPFYEEKS